MAYCTITDLKNYIPRDVLQQLTDDETIDDIDLEKSDFAIRQADDLIDGYLRGRYTVPLTTVPSMISDVAVKIATYFLFKRSLIVTLPEPIKDDYNDSMQILREIQRGRISPFPVTENPVWFVSSKSSGSVSMVNQATNYQNDYLIRATGGSSSTRFQNPGSL